MAQTAYHVFERRTIERVIEVEGGEPETHEVSAYFPVAGLESGNDPILANSGIDASHKAAEMMGIPIEEFGERGFFAAPVNYWSGAVAEGKFQLTFRDVRPPKKETAQEGATQTAEPPPEPETPELTDEERAHSVAAGEPDPGEPDPTAEPDPAFDPAPDDEVATGVGAEGVDDVPPAEEEEPEFDASMTASGSTEQQ